MLDRVFKAKFRRDIISERVVNLTGENIQTYNSQGEIICLEDQSKSFDTIPTEKETIMYIVDEKTYEKIKSTGRNTRDLVKARFSGKGRGEKNIWTLLTYKNSRVYPA